MGNEEHGMDEASAAAFAEKFPTTHHPDRESGIGQLLDHAEVKPEGSEDQPDEEAK